MLRYVILTHDWPNLHWDLMLEWDGQLLSWRILEEPELDIPLEVQRTSDHRIEYLDYTGPVTGDRGEVQRWDRGSWVKVASEDSHGETELRGVFQSEKYAESVIFEIKNNILTLQTRNFAR